MVENSIESAELTTDEFRRKFHAGLIAAWLIPPATGELGMTFLGFWELRDAGFSLIRFTGIYIAVFTLIAFFVLKYLVIEPVVALGDRQPTLIPAHTRRVKAFPWIFWGLLGLYSGFGPATVLLSNSVFQGTEYTLGQYAFSAFGVIPFLLIAAFPLFFYLTDLLGRFLAPRGVSLMVAPLWLKVTVLGLFTPVMIDTILLTYYLNRTGFLAIETIVLWVVLLLIAAAGTRVALRSVHQGMQALKQPLGEALEAGVNSYPVPRSLDEFGLLARGWADLLKSRDHAERAVRERDRRVRDIIDNTDAVIYIKDKAGRYLLVNRRFEQLFGISNDDVIGKTDHAIFPKEVAEAFRHNDLKVVRDEKPLAVQESAPHEDGPHTYISQKFPLYDADQVFYGVCGISNDITERLRADEKLRQSEARLSGIIQVANDAIITVDHSQKIILFNQGAERVFGYSPDAVLGRPLEVLLPERFHNRHRENIKHFANGALSARQMSDRSIPLLGRRKSGKEFPLEASISKLELGGEKIFTVALRDITARKRAETALQDSQDRHNEAQRLARLGHWDFDLVTNELEWSNEIYRIFDVDPRNSRASYELFLDTVHPDDREFVDKTYTNSVKNKAPYDIVHRLLLKDGRVKHVNERCETLYDAEGNPLRSTGTVQDITDRVRISQALHESEAQVRLLLESTAEAIYGVDLRGECTFANPACLRMLGYRDQAELLGRNMHALIHHTRADGNFYPVEACRIYRTFHEGRGVHVDDEVLWRADGGSFPAEYWSHPMRIDDKIIGSVVTFVDISERVEAEETRRRQSEGLAVLDEWVNALLQQGSSVEEFFDVVSQGVLALVNADLAALPLLDESGKAFTYVAASGANAELLKGKTMPVRAGGLCGWVVVHGEPLRVPDLADDPRVVPELALALNVNTAVLTPLRQEDKVIGGLSAFRNGQPFDEVDKQNLNLFGQRVAIALINLRLRLSLEQRVAARTRELAATNERLKELDQLKSMFIASMSHELRTPLNSIIGFTGIVLQGLAGPLSEEQTKQLGMVQGSARHLLELINDVLDLSKIEAGEVDIVPQTFDVGEAIEKAVQKVTPSAAKKGLTMSVVVAPEVGCVISDRRRVEQILINLVNNAVKFTEHGEVRVECRLSEDRLVTCVKDTGIGIEPGDLDNLFKEFRQLDTGLNRKQEGTGLGLSICKKLLALLGGDIRVESNPGDGSVFTFTLPMKIGE